LPYSAGNGFKLAGSLHSSLIYLSAWDCMELAGSGDILRWVGKVIGVGVYGRIPVSCGQ